MDTYFLTNRFGELVVYNLKKLSVDVINKLGIIQQIGEFQVIIDKNVNDIGHLKSDVEYILNHLTPSEIHSITNEEIDELLNS